VQESEWEVSQAAAEPAAAEEPVEAAVERMAETVAEPLEAAAKRMAETAAELEAELLRSRAASVRSAVVRNRMAVSWQAAIEQEIVRLRTELAAANEESRDGAETVESAHGRVEESLRLVEDLLDEQDRRGRLSRMAQSGRTYELALAAVQQAAEDLLLVQSEAAVRAQVSSLRAAVWTYLGPDDPRTDVFVRFCDNLLDNNLLKRKGARSPTPDAAPTSAATYRSGR